MAHVEQALLGVVLEDSSKLEQKDKSDKGTGTVEWDRNNPGTPGGEVPWCLLSQGMEVRRWSQGHQAASFSSCSGSYQEFKQHLRLMESCWDVLVTSS